MSFVQSYNKSRYSSINIKGNGILEVEIDGVKKTFHRTFKSIEQINGDVYLDGKKLDVFENDTPTQPSHTINFIINGTFEKVSGDQITLHGNVEGEVHSTNGDVTIEGTVRGNVSSQNGDIKITGDVDGSVKSSNGDVKVKGYVKK